MSYRFNLLGRPLEEVVQLLPSVSGTVKLVCGVANNAAWMVMLDGYDHARRCRRYGFAVKKAFKQAMAEWDSYEHGLLFATHNRMFRVADMVDGSASTYTKMTDREYYDFWVSTGCSAYEKTRPLITSLWNKHRLALINHGIGEAEHVAWVLTAHATLELAVVQHEKVITDCINDLRIPHAVMREVFGQFSLQRVLEAWRRAMLMLAPELKVQLTSSEMRNIDLGLIQLADAWMADETLYGSTISSIEDYGELFRSRGMQKKAIRELREAMNND